MTHDDISRAAMKRWWCSWYEAGEFEYHGPWWVSGSRTVRDRDQAMLCAAVVAKDEADAKRIIREAHEKKRVRIEWRFVEARPDDWEPFGDRFERGAWMRWPWPEAGR